MGFSFEQRGNFDRDDFVEAAARKADLIIAQSRIPMDSFVDMYGSERISKDKAYLEGVKKQIRLSGGGQERETSKFARVWEAMVHDVGNKGEWFGKGTTLIKTSELDDIANGIDEVVEFRADKAPNARSFLALGMDVTYNPYLDRKLQRVKDGIDRNELGTVKYFADPKNEIRGELNKIPQVVVGVDSHTVKRLAQLWLESERMEFSRKELHRHDVQWQILEEIEMQCQAFAAYAKTKAKPEIGQRYLDTGAIVAEIMSEKKRLGLPDSGRRDEVYYAIQTGLQSLKM